MRGQIDVCNDNHWKEVEQITGWFSRDEAIAMQRIVKQLAPGARLVELGSFQGRSSVVIASVLSKDSRLYCVDHFEGSAEHQGQADLDNLLEIFINNIKKFHVDNKIRALAMTTLEAATKFTEKSLDLVFIDASHDYESVKSDILQWYPKIKPGRFLICHDYQTPGWPGVAQAIEILQLSGEMIGGSLWLHQKAKRRRAQSPWTFLKRLMRLIK